MFEFDESIDQNAKIKVVGIGGGGGNAVNTMISCDVFGVDFIVANTDAQSLRMS
ncbi:MAG: cell division protein FtsZ, partial [Geobacteraceae bacterium]